MIQAHQLTKRYGDKTAVHTLSMFTLIIFHFALGWKVYRLSRSPVRNLNGRDKMSLSKA